MANCAYHGHGLRMETTIRERCSSLLAGPVETQIYVNKEEENKYWKRYKAPFGLKQCRVRLISSQIPILPVPTIRTLERYQMIQALFFIGFFLLSRVARDYAKK